TRALLPVLPGREFCSDRVPPAPSPPRVWGAAARWKPLYVPCASPPDHDVLWHHTHHAEAQEVIAVTDHRVTIGHSADVRLVVPGAAPAHTIETRLGPFGISDRPGRIFAFPVLHPLPDIA